MDKNIKIQIIFLIFIPLLNYIQSCFEYSCEKCLSEEYGTCIKCRDTYRLIDGTCPCYNPACAICETGLYLPYSCIQCKNEYKYEGCNSFIDACKIRSNNICLKCDDGYTYNKNNNKCEKIKEKMKCKDLNCFICINLEEEGTCIKCEEGYQIKKGKCIKVLPVNNKTGSCDYNNSFLIGNYCYDECFGLKCYGYYIENFNRCYPSKCIYCHKIHHFLMPSSGCDDNNFCRIDGCAMCFGRYDCYKCGIGRYYINATCRKCVEGCASCTNNKTCIYCLSGFELTENKTCKLTYNFDFDLELYTDYKNKNFPEKCDDMYCIKCDNYGKTCKKCKYNYSLRNNTCIFSGKCNIGYGIINNTCIKCSDDNCKSCPNDKDNCTEAKVGYYVNNGAVFRCNKTVANCIKCINETICRGCSNDLFLYFGLCAHRDGCENQFKHCRTCTDDKCLECDSSTKFNKEGECENSNYVFWIVIGIVILYSLFTIIFLLVKYSPIGDLCRRNRSSNSNNRHIHAIEERRSENDSDSNRNIIEKNYRDEFDKQKLKKEKGIEYCQFCKKKPGKFICGCGCVVCLKHSELKKVEGENGYYKICLVCGKNIIDVKPINVCGICLENASCVAHFKCGCAFEVCCNCYVKCKLEDQKCPACRKPI